MAVRIPARIPAYQTLMVPTFQALQSLGGSADIFDIDNFVQKTQKLTDTDRQELRKRLVWSRTYLKKYGLIKNPSKGYWSIEEQFLNYTPDQIKLHIKNASIE